MNVEEKKSERFEKEVDECNDFMGHFPESGYAKEVEQYLTLSQNNLKNTANEPVKTTT